MALYRVEGVVLRVQDLAEADRLVVFLTADRGKLKAVARGARRLHSRLAAGIQPFTRSIALCWQGRNLDGISQVQVVESFRPLRENLFAMAAATYACELMDAVTAEGDSSPRLYGLLLTALRLLAQLAEGDRSVNSSEMRSFHHLLLALQWKTLALVGFRPELAKCVVCGNPSKGNGPVRLSLTEGGIVCSNHSGIGSGTVTVPHSVIGAIKGLLRVPLRASLNLKLTPAEIGALTGISRAFLNHNLERELRSEQWLELLRLTASNPT